MPTYYHGGTPGLALGEVLQPPSVTGIVSETWALTIAAKLESETDQRRDKIYLTTDPSLAKFYAMVWRDPHTGVQGGGAVYEVGVDSNTIEPDPDLTSSNCWQADAGTILRVHTAAVSYDQDFLDKRLDLTRAKLQRREVRAVLNLDEFKGLFG
ncbi:hypothetical protein [Arthrobacter nitrophenolicus]|uniref:Uncharacterized protein n=1 Tax=Arthrobacter nitrophenolicus TaxID=683150 RepID=A0A4R5YAX5_9MICC|nr:hypothetical protein [Arthrobacter nitrophenolicus]TDL41116.1 hypothetical protein E2R57_00030 [Arthrobacter nitrophenolicus]